jgi:hypothetical protein
MRVRILLDRYVREAENIDAKLSAVMNLSNLHRALCLCDLVCVTRVKILQETHTVRWESRCALRLR